MIDCTLIAAGRRLKGQYRVGRAEAHYSITPLLHYSITPLLHYSITPSLRAKVDLVDCSGLTRPFTIHLSLLTSQ